MLYQWLTQMFEEVADNETRSVTLFNHPTLPMDTYYFAEFFCDDPTCDCRRVMVSVMAKKRFRQPDLWDLASISHAFEPPDPDSPIVIPGQTYIVSSPRPSPCSSRAPAGAVVNTRGAAWLPPKEGERAAPGLAESGHSECYP